jgi:hypothetical protein
MIDGTSLMMDYRSRGHNLGAPSMDYPCERPVIFIQRTTFITRNTFKIHNGSYSKTEIYVNFNIRGVQNRNTSLLLTAPAMRSSGSAAR